MIHSKRQHSGWATAASRRGESYLGCTTHGMSPAAREAIVRLRQAEPYKAPSSISVVMGCAAHLAGAVLMGLVFWAFIVGMVLS